jgi:hypothetical protein
VIAWFAALVALSLMATPGAGATRFAVVVGNNLGGQENQPLRYAERDAAQVASVMRTLGGVEHVEVLLGQDASALRNALRRAQESLHDGDLLFFYYSGHARERHLQMNGTEFGFGELRAALSTKAGGTTIAVIDACGSGGIARSKGGKAIPTVTVQFPEQPHTAGQVFISSSTADEVSQESNDLHGSFFTHYFVVGLRGAADSSSDGVVTLEEAYRYAYAHTLLRTSETLGGPQHPTFDISLRGRGQLALTTLSAIQSSLLLERDVEGELTLDNGRDIIEIEKSGTDAPLRLALASGSYRVRLRKGRQSYEGRAVVPPQGTTTLARSDLVERADVYASAKGLNGGGVEAAGGGGPASSASHHGIRLLLGGGVTTSYLHEAPLIGFGSLGVLLASGHSRLGAALRVGKSSGPSRDGLGSELVDAGLLVRAAYVLALRQRFELMGGMIGELIGVRQRTATKPTLYSAGGRVGLEVSAAFRAGASWGFDLGVQSGAVLCKADGQIEIRPSVMAGAGGFLEF